MSEEMRKYRAIVVGGIWMPYGAPASAEYTFMAESTEDAEDRLHMKAGDFSSIEHFELSEWQEVCPSCHQHGWMVVVPFSEDGEIAYCDTLAPVD